tara:strand:- start:1743 stop:1922 length:180 start_codon:yes stop_codon:yes gene_type:complete
MYYLYVDSYTKTINLLHQKLLQARTKDQEDRIVNLMVAEIKRHQMIRNKDRSEMKTTSN